VTGFIDTPAGPVPQVTTTRSSRDLWGTIGARIGIIRRNYKVAPGLYAVGSPGNQSAVLVSANYKLSFDALRHQLGGLDAWLLVVDTRGINVWCAAGKGTFSTWEVIDCVQRYRLNEVVAHRELILPQLAAPGVSAQAVRKGCGFTVLFGPVRAADLPAYLGQGNRCDEAMREVTFPLADRAVLIPVELFLLAKPLLAMLILGFLLSGISPTIFSLTAALERGEALLAATGLGMLGGAVLTPMLLPWLPGRQFWLKGVWAGLPAALGAWLLLAARLAAVEQVALISWVLSLSSYLAMNFTGSTPFTSPSGVEYEMRRGLPVQLAATCLALVLWLASPFLH